MYHVEKGPEEGFMYIYIHVGIVQDMDPMKAACTYIYTCACLSIACLQSQVVIYIYSLLSMSRPRPCLQSQVVIYKHHLCRGLSPVCSRRLLYTSLVSRPCLQSQVGIRIISCYTHHRCRDSALSAVTGFYKHHLCRHTHACMCRVAISKAA